MTSIATLSNCRELIAQSFQASQAFQKGALSKDEATNEIEQAISTDYSYGSAQIDSLTNFVRTVFDIGNIAISPVTTEIGWSGNNVFWVEDIETTEIKLFLKVFKDSTNFLPELYGLDYLQRVQGVVSQNLQALGKFYIDGCCHFVIAETPAKGHSFQYYYNEVAKYAIGSEDRQKALQTLIQGSRICGIALANLHIHVRGELLPLPEETEKAMRADLERAISKLEQFPQEGVEIDRLKKCVDVAIKRMESEFHPTGVAHGDIKLIHVFYHPKDQQISLIGSHQLINSFGQDGSLQGVPAKDYYTFIRSLLLNRFGYGLDVGLQPHRQELLTVDEVSQVINSFQEGYKTAGGIGLTEIEEDFFLLKHNLTLIRSLDRVLPEPDLTRLKDLVKLSLDDIRHRLAGV